MTVTLLSLPNELLEKILEDNSIPPSTLYQLAFQCRRLHEICLAAYIKKSDLPKVNERCIVTIPERAASHDLMTALCLSSAVTQAQYFCCNFPRFATDQTMLQHFGRVERFVAKLKAVNEVVLNFNSPEEATYVFREDDAIAWSERLGALLNAIVERGCSSLQVRGLKTMDLYREVMVASPPLQPPSLLSQLKGLLLSTKPTLIPSVLEGQSWKYERVRNPTMTNQWNLNFFSPTQEHILTQLSPQARAHSSLTHLTIATKSFLCPPVLQWTYSVLSVSPITDLTIEDVSFFGPTWSILTDILPQSVPTLKGLELRNCEGLSDQQIAQFIKGFPNIESLSLDQLSSFWTETLRNGPPAELPALNQLTTIKGEAKWILPVLTSSPTTFPALKHVKIILSQAGFGRHRRTRITRRDTVQSLSEQSLLDELAKLGPNPTFSVDIELLAPEEIVSWMQGLTQHKNPSDQITTWMSCISGIILVVDTRLEWSHERKVKDTIRRWYQQFPRLRKLIINSLVDEGYVVRSVELFCQLKLSKVVKGLDHFEVNGRLWELLVV